MTQIDQNFLFRAQEVVDENISNAEFTAEEFAQQLLLSRSQLHRKLKQLTGKSTTDYIRCTRLKKAAELLQNENCSIAQVAYQVGFNNLSYFAKCFRIEFGCTPSIFQNNNFNT